MTPEQFKEGLWDSYNLLENLSIECERTTMEMMQGEKVEECLTLALRAIGSCIDIVNVEYFPQCLE